MEEQDITSNSLNLLFARIYRTNLYDLLNSSYANTSTELSNTSTIMEMHSI
jgi:hypothetical protein